MADGDGTNGKQAQIDDIRVAFSEFRDDFREFMRERREALEKMRLEQEKFIRETLKAEAQLMSREDCGKVHGDTSTQLKELKVGQEDLRIGQQDIRDQLSQWKGSVKVLVYILGPLILAELALLIEHVRTTGFP